MAEGVGGVGEAATAGVGPRPEEANACLNCGAGLTDEYCHRCGQQGNVHSSLAAFWHDLAHGVLHFEGKIWRTLPMLAWRPGELTRRYIAGERVRFVSPIALFLFSVFLMFVTYSAVGPPVTQLDLSAVSVGRSQAPQASRKRNVLDREAGLAKLKRDQEREERTRALRAERALAVAEGRSTAAIDTAILQKLAHSSESQVQPWARSLRKKVQENPSLLIYKLQNNAYKFSWALIPISVPFLWLLFAGNRRYAAYHHTVFVTYSITFMTLGAVVLSLLFAAGLANNLLLLLAALVPPLHIYRQLLGAYDMTWFGAAWRAVLLTGFALVAAALFLGLLIVMGVAG